MGVNTDIQTMELQMVALNNILKKEREVIDYFTKKKEATMQEMQDLKEKLTQARIEECHKSQQSL